MAEEEAEEEQGNSKKKLIIFIVIGAVALLLIGGGVAYLLLGGEEEPSTEQQADDKGSKGEEKKASSDLDADGNFLPPLYYNIKEPFLATLPPGGKHKLLQISLQVLTRQQAMLAFMEENYPMIRHHLLNLFNAQNSEALKTRAGKEKLQADVKQKIQELAEEMSVDGTVSNAYFIKMVME
jgi:flagellar FliL protein